MLIQESRRRPEMLLVALPIVSSVSGCYAHHELSRGDFLFQA